jgi:hypothetical protein
MKSSTHHARSRRRASAQHRAGQRHEGAWQYLPVLVIIVFSLLAASAKLIGYDEGWNARRWMHDFMGFFLLIFSLFKFFDLPGFADGFRMYDLLAKAWSPYAYCYPFLELSLGLAYLAGLTPAGVYAATVLLTGVGAIGVIRALRQGLDLNCACMGTVLKVPLSTVALVEDVGMAIMAAVMWASG